jgi:hypothetical protein
MRSRMSSKEDAREFISRVLRGEKDGKQH